MPTPGNGRLPHTCGVAGDEPAGGPGTLLTTKAVKVLGIDEMELEKVMSERNALAGKVLEEFLALPPDVQREEIGDKILKLGSVKPAPDTARGIAPVFPIYQAMNDLRLVLDDITSLQNTGFTLSELREQREQHYREIGEKIGDRAVGIRRPLDLEGKFSQPSDRDE